MSIESDTYTYLKTITALTDIVGTRIYPHHLPSDPTYPAMTYQVISSEHVEALDGGIGIVKCRIEFNVWSKKLTECINGIAALRATLKRHVGTYGARRCLSAKHEADRDLSEKPVDGSQLWLFRKSSEYYIALTE